MNSTPSWAPTISAIGQAAGAGVGPRGAHDRTAEFFATADSLRRRQGPDQQYSAPAPPPTSSAAVNFNKAALEISKMITNTTARLESLGNIAQKRTLFNDMSEKISQLTSFIKSDLSTISSEIDILARYGQDHQTGAKQVDGHALGVVKDLKTKVAEQAKVFQDILKVRSANMRSQDSRRGQYSAASTSSGSFGMRQRPEMSQAQEQSQALLAAPSRSADTYLESRADAMSNIDSTIQELGEMYQRLAIIVSTQGEQISRIDDNVVVTMGNVEGAHEQLVMYWDRMRSNRGLIIKIFLVLIVFAVFFIGVIA